MLHHDVVHEVLEFLPAAARLLHHPPEQRDDGPFLGGGGGVFAHRGGRPVGDELLQARRNLVHGEADAVQWLAPDVMEPLGRIEHKVIKPV